MWITAVLAGAVFGSGAALLLREFLPSTPRLSAAFDRLGAAPADTDGSNGKPGRRKAIGSWIEQKVGFAGVLRAPDRDLAVLGLNLHEHLARKGIYAGGALALFTTAALAQILQGRLSSSVGLGLLLAIGAWFLPDLLVKRRAAEARDDFRRAVGTYAELVAMEGYAGRHVTEALSSAANVGRSFVFARIRQELARAQLSGEQSWVGLTRLAEAITVPELAELADIMRLAGEKEVTVYQTLRARGKALRITQLTELKTGANRRTTNMLFPLTLMAAGFLGILITPAISRLFSL